MFHRNTLPVMSSIMLLHVLCHILFLLKCLFVLLTCVESGKKEQFRGLSKNIIDLETTPKIVIQSRSSIES